MKMDINIPPNIIQKTWQLEDNQLLAKWKNVKNEWMNEPTQE